MMYKLKILEIEIQYWRGILHKLIILNSLTDRIVVDCSHKLDKLLNEYEMTKLKTLNIIYSQQPQS